jgi:serine/threonine protein kinase
MIILEPGQNFADSYQLVRFIDTGGFAEVWEAVFMGETVALKIFPKLNEEGVEKVKAQFAESKLLHTHLIVPRHFGVYDGRPYFVMNFCGGGNASRKIGECDEKELAKCIFHIAGALAYLHENEYVHQDIKPNNILLDNRENYYLTDLGLSVKLRQTIRRYTQGINEKKDNKTTGTAGIAPACYRGPELYNNTSISKPPLQASDIWAFGATIFEIASGDVPFGELGGMVQVNNPEPPDLPNSFSPEFNSIIKKCLAKETWDRPKASDLEEWAGYYLKHGRWPEHKVGPEPPVTPVITSDPLPPWKKILLIAIPILIIGVVAIFWNNIIKSTPDTIKPPEKADTVNHFTGNFIAPPITRIDQNNSKLKAIVEMGATGFDYSIIRMDTLKQWELVRYKPGWSLVFEGDASYDDILSKLRDYIAEIYNSGVRGENIHFIISSGAAQGERVPQIREALQTINGYVVTEVDAQTEAIYALKCALPNGYNDEAFVVDIGSSNTKIAWKNESGIIITASTEGSKYRKKDISDKDVYDSLIRVTERIPTRNRKNCFIIGGVPYQLAEKLRSDENERYTRLRSPNTYDAKGDDKLIGGLNIYNALAVGTDCKTFVFDWSSHFGIGFLLSLNY